MFGQLIPVLRRRPWLALIPAAFVALAVAWATWGRSAPRTTALAPASAPAPSVFNDTGTQLWKIEAPAPAPRPPLHLKRPARPPAPDVDWTALAAGASDVAVDTQPLHLAAADLHTGLSAAQAREIVADAERSPGRQQWSGGVPVVGRGTPREGGGHGGCK